MSKCTIFVELDEPTRQYTPGDTVRGEVHVMVNSDCKCDALTVELAWETHGRGNHAEGVHTLDVPFQGQWTSGTEHRYPFEFELPNGPYTYHGHYLNVDWYVRANADIPWAIDPKGKTEVLLGPGDPTSNGSDPDSYINRGEFHTGLSQLQPHATTGNGCMIVVALPFLGFGLLTMVAPFFDTSGEVDFFSALFGLVFAAAGGAMLFGALRNPMAKMKLGQVDVELPDEALQPGDALPVTVRVDAAARGKLDEAKATLICRERVVSGSGTNRTTHTEDILSEALFLQEKSTPGGPRLVMEGTHRLPDDAAPSFYADDNELLWLVEVHVDVPNWPDYKTEHYFEVLPKVSAGSGNSRPEDGEAGGSGSNKNAPELEPGTLW